MISAHSSLPPLISSQMSEPRLSSEVVRKQLEKNDNIERQSPELAKEEVELRENILHSSKISQTLKSLDP